MQKMFVSLTIIWHCWFQINCSNWICTTMMSDLNINFYNYEVVFWYFSFQLQIYNQLLIVLYMPVIGLIEEGISPILYKELNHNFTTSCLVPHIITSPYKANLCWHCDGKRHCFKDHPIYAVCFWIDLRQHHRKQCQCSMLQYTTLRIISLTKT